jgi:hypothetical protein
MIAQSISYKQKGETMNIKQLKELITELPDDMLVTITAYESGVTARFSASVTGVIKTKSSNWSGEYDVPYDQSDAEIQVFLLDRK